MALTKREKLIVAGVGAALAFLIVDQLAIEPYFAAAEVLRTQKATEEKRAGDRVELNSHAHRLEKVWTDITNAGLTDNESNAATQARSAVLEWALASYVNLTSTKAERTTESTGLPFDVISFHVTATGSTPSISKFLMSFETAKVPVRIVDMKIEPQKEGTDDLKIEMTISTLCLKPTAAAAG